MTPKMHPKARLEQLEYLYSGLKETDHMAWTLRRLRQLTTALEKYADPENYHDEGIKLFFDPQDSNLGDWWTARKALENDADE